MALYGNLCSACGKFKVKGVSGEFFWYCQGCWDFGFRHPKDLNKQEDKMELGICNSTAAPAPQKVWLKLVTSGGGGVMLKAFLDEAGQHEAPSGNLLTIQSDGTLLLYAEINRNLGLALNENGQLTGRKP